MTSVLTTAQLADLASINQVCAELGADLVVIGAMSLLIHFGNLGRYTRDIDLTVALDLDEFAGLTARLTAGKWTRAPKVEHRWIAPKKTIVDLLPAGPGLRGHGSITWPESQFTMSLAGFEHVFSDAVKLSLPEGTIIRVAALSSVALLKMIAYMEDPYRRAKDLQDIRLILSRYEQGSDRLFSDAVFDARLPDFAFTGAFLLGIDMSDLVPRNERRYVEEFVKRFLLDEDEIAWDNETDSGRNTFLNRILAFSKGFAGNQI
jgi:predicted nucleotidyltransferase